MSVHELKTWQYRCDRCGAVQTCQGISAPQRPDGWTRAVERGCGLTGYDRDLDFCPPCDPKLGKNRRSLLPMERKANNQDEPLPEDAAIVARREGYAAGQIEALEHAIREAEVEVGPSASRGSSGGSSGDFLAGWRRGASEVGIRLHGLLRTMRGRAAKFADGGTGHG